MAASPKIKPLEFAQHAFTDWVPLLSAINALKTVSISVQKSTAYFAIHYFSQYLIYN